MELSSISVCRRSIAKGVQWWVYPIFSLLPLNFAGQVSRQRNLSIFVSSNEKIIPCEVAISERHVNEFTAINEGIKIGHTSIGTNFGWDEARRVVSNPKADFHRIHHIEYFLLIPQNNCMPLQCI